ncbi:unnamed protein product [Zymoseptoria tritici ST99CH_3D1]|nr:unnamed protein product [Zymoseptoria tritici ST99CH_3D1]
MAHINTQHVEDQPSESESSAETRPSTSTSTLIAGIRSRHKPRPSRLQSPTAVTAGFVANIADPGTPSDESNADHDEMESPVNQSLFHNYLRAMHPFDPADSNTISDDDDALSTAAIKPGDLILVHCVHANGWADGTVLNTSVRGWLPTNYCEAYDHPYLRNLLNAMTQFWDLIGAGEDANLSTFVRQDYIRGLIAGVRHLLERADCLHRDSPTVKQNVGVRRMRKGLLADLSSLVQIAKRLQETISEPFAGEVIPYLLDDLINKAFKVVNRAVGFLDVWTQEVSVKRNEIHRFDAPRARLAINTQDTYRRPPYDTIDSAKHFPEQIPSYNHQRDLSAYDDELCEMPVRRSVAFTPPDGFAAHRMSLVSKEPTSATTGPLASEKLAKAHDVCISHIGAFIGHHLHSRPSSELVATTERLVAACRSMLAIIDEVYAHDPKASSHVQQVKCDFEAKVEQLALTTQDVFRFSDSPDEEVVMLPEQTDHLISVGTSLIRNTGECVVKTRQLIEQIGDFELKAWSATPASAQETAIEIPERVDSIPVVSPRPLSTSLPLHQHRVSVNRLSVKLLPPPPCRPAPSPKDQQELLTVGDENTDLAVHSPAETNSSFTSTSTRPTSKQSMPPPPKRQSRTLTAAEAQKSTVSFQSDNSSAASARKNSVGQSTQNSARDSGISEASTRATTPDHAKDLPTPETSMLSSFASLSSLRSLSDDSVDPESLLAKTYANELTFNKEGQVTGGSLSALVEQLTSHDSAPDAQFVTAFFLTFRKFSEPREFAQALIHRFEYIGDSQAIGTPARLRVYNVFKGWLEMYWSPEADKDALGEIRFFALHKLKQHLPSASERLIELTRRVTEAYHTNTEYVSKSNLAYSVNTNGSLPEPVISNKQLNALRLAVGGGQPISITDLEPLEVARQITLIVMKVYCDIHPQELLSMDWSKPNTKRARNVRRMCLLNTDLSHVVADTILAPDSPKARAGVIKHWAKVGVACLELQNYDSVMSIMCTINSSVVKRLKKTWEFVHKKTHARFEELEKLVDMSKNYTSLRKRLDGPTGAGGCLPFLGVYLTDLTFVIAGNPKRRELPGTLTATGQPLSVINFDMYARISRIISHLQRFQMPYHLKPVPELQSWLEAHLERMRVGATDVNQVLHERSLAVEPKMDDSQALAGAVAGAGGVGLGLVGLGLGAKKGNVAALSGEPAVNERPKTSSGRSESGASSFKHGASADMMERFGTLWKGGGWRMGSHGSGHSAAGSPTVEVMSPGLSGGEEEARRGASR